MPLLSDEIQSRAIKLPLPFGERAGVRGQPRERLYLCIRNVKRLLGATREAYDKSGPSPQPPPRRGEGADAAMLKFRD
jgi:hypothetical protein